MCEPNHSIVQYPDHPTDDDDQAPPFSSQMDQETQIKSVLGRVADWGRKVLRWFHFSKLGGGHAAATLVTARQSLLLPSATNYEGEWWARKIKVDGMYCGPKVDQAEAFDAAKTYYNDVAVGSLSKFRRFLGTSIMRSPVYGMSYVTRFLEGMLTPEGRDKLLAKFRAAFGIQNARGLDSLFGFSAKSKPKPKQQAVDCLLGFTRQRGLFVPVWADDASLWK